MIRPICYVSRALTLAEKRYSTIEREALAVMYCIIRCKYLLMHRQIEVNTDHRPLLFVFKSSIPEGRLGRLTLKVQEYDIKFFNKQGKHKLVADCLSRYPPEENENEQQGENSGRSFVDKYKSCF